MENKDAISILSRNVECLNKRSICLCDCKSCNYYVPSEELALATETIINFVKEIVEEE